jgi:tyrosyl-tRNA synthetase
MSIPDELLPQYEALCVPSPGASDIVGRAGDPPRGREANVAKRAMARSVVALYHDDAAATAAEDRFDRVHRDRAIPEDVPEAALPDDIAAEATVWLPRLLAALGLAESNSDGRRKIEGGGVRLDGEVVSDSGAELVVAELPGRILQVGRRDFVRIAPARGT